MNLNGPRRPRGPARARPSCGRPATPWPDPGPHYLKRALPLLGRTLDSCRLADVLTAASSVLLERNQPQWNIAGRGAAGVIAAYAALLEGGRFHEVVMVDPPSSHREGPIFLNVLRVLDIPEALGLLAPRPLTVYSSATGAFARTASLYQVGGGMFKLEGMP